VGNLSAPVHTQKCQDLQHYEVITTLFWIYVWHMTMAAKDSIPRYYLEEATDLGSSSAISHSRIYGQRSP